jgi:hypothetical protein
MNYEQLLIGSYNETITIQSHLTSGLAFVNKSSSDHCPAMLGNWEDAMAAMPHTMNIDREEHSVSMYTTSREWHMSATRHDIFHTVL